MQRTLLLLSFISLTVQATHKMWLVTMKLFYKNVFCNTAAFFMRHHSLIYGHNKFVHKKHFWTYIFLTKGHEIKYSDLVIFSQEVFVVYEVSLLWSYWDTVEKTSHYISRLVFGVHNNFTVRECFIFHANPTLHKHLNWAITWIG